MKIIDLLNKIANGEEVPEKIIYKDKIYNFDCKDGDYFNNENNEYLLADLFERCYTQDFINDIVGIIEEKKIPEKLTDILRVADLIPPVDENMYKIWIQTIKNHNKINEICNYLKSKGDE